MGTGVAHGPAALVAQLMYVRIVQFSSSGSFGSRPQLHRPFVLPAAAEEEPSLQRIVGLVSFMSVLWVKNSTKSPVGARAALGSWEKCPNTTSCRVYTPSGRSAVACTTTEFATLCGQQEQRQGPFQR